MQGSTSSQWGLLDASSRAPQLDEIQPMKSPRILITGASGWIGRSLFLHLHKFEPMGVYCNSTIASPTDRWVKADLRNEAEVAKILKNYQPDVIFHLAALPSPRKNREQPLLAEATNVGITKNLVAQLANDTRIIFLSSDKVFAGGDRATTEESPADSSILHGQLKLQCEQIITAAHAKYHILRLATVHGFGESPSNSFIDKALRRLVLGEQVYAFQNVSRCYMKIGELLDVLGRLIEDEHYGIYHLGSPLKTYYDRIRDLCEETGIAWRGNLLATDGDVVPQSQNLNTDKIKRLLNCVFT